MIKDLCCLCDRVAIQSVSEYVREDGIYLVRWLIVDGFGFRCTAVRERLVQISPSQRARLCKQAVS
jgi:hypothetical protein